MTDRLKCSISSTEPTFYFVQKSVLHKHGSFIQTAKIKCYTELECSFETNIDRSIYLWSAERQERQCKANRKPQAKTVSMVNL